MKNLILMIAGLMLTMTACAKKDYLVTIKTSYGDIKVILYDQTPNHKANFLKLAESGDYDSTIFHRVMKNFMIQGGDVNAKPGNEKKIDYTIPAEFVDTLFHHKGALAAARFDDRNNPTKASSGCQWYIVEGSVFDEAYLKTDMEKLNEYLQKLMQKPEYVKLQEELTTIYYGAGEEAYVKKLMGLKPILEQEFNTTFDKDYPADRLNAYTTIGGSPHLDDAYTVFGCVVEGLDVVDKISEVETAGRNKPKEDIYMTMEVEKVNVKKLKKQYGI